MPCGAILDLYLIISNHLGEFGCLLWISVQVWYSARYLVFVLSFVFGFLCLLTVFGSSQVQSI